MNAVIYARYSSEKQQEISIEGQVRVCREYCERNDWDVVDVYTDRALSASKNALRRDAFQQMIRDSARRKFDLVVVYKLSRFARNRYDSAVYKRKLRSNGVRVASATEAIGDDPQGALLEGIMESLDEYYSKSLAQDVLRGMHENASKGLSTGGTIPLGYRSINKQLVPDSQYAPVVAEIFQRYSDGWSYQQMADDLNSRGIRTAGGKLFSKNSFNAILRNRKYIGEYNYNGEITIEDAIPPLVLREVFESVEHRLSLQRMAPARSKADEPYLLTPKIFCSECGAHMAGESGKSRSGAKHQYYACGHRKRGKGCKLKSIRKHLVEDYVISVASELLTPERIPLITASAMTEYRRLQGDNSALNAAQCRLKEIDSGISNILKSIESGVSSKSFISRVNDLEAQKEQVEAEIMELERGMPDLKADDLNRFLVGFAKQASSSTFAANLIDIFVNSVFVAPGEDDIGHHVTVVFNLTDPHGEALKCSDLLIDGVPLQANPNQWRIVAVGSDLFLVA